MAKPVLRFTSIMLVAAMAGPALAQERLTAVILRGASSRAGSAGAAPAVLQPGMRVESPAGSWTELAFSDGSSIVLESGADFTLQGIGREPAGGRLMVRGCAGRGRLRISTSDRVGVAVCTAGAMVRVIGGSAVLAAGRGGSVTLLDGGRVVVARNGQEDVIRRPGFSLLFDDGIQRRSRVELAALIDPFAPVAMGGGAAGVVEVAEAPQPSPTQRSTRERARLLANEGTLVAAPPPPPPPPTTVTQPRTGGALALALAGPLGGSTAGSGFNAPATNPGTSSLNSVAQSFGSNSGAVVAAPNALITDLGQAAGDTSNGLTQFGTGRVRRFTPGSSGSSAARNDTGVVSVGGTAAPVGGFFQNVANAGLNASGSGTFYDAVANVGVVTLVVLQETSEFSGGLGFTSLGLFPCWRFPMWQHRHSDSPRVGIRATSRQSCATILALRSSRTHWARRRPRMAPWRPCKGTTG
ncbi:hypothetical protein [Dankookia sp. P2]|uniref:hypothetical protein n=1 Tax=Dankookia sp. P2 TaxID=3423955 RepID=UPI003D665E14